MWATPVLLLVLVVLLLAYLRKTGILSLDWLKANKDALAAMSSLVSTVVAVLAGILAYYRFFRGRTFTTRVELSINVDAVSGPRGSCLHLAIVSAKNIGTITIWEPRISLHVVARHSDGHLSEETIDVDQWYEVSDEHRTAGPRLSAIDSGESAEFSSEQSFAQDVWAVTYTAILSCTTGDSWSKTKIVRGVESDAIGPNNLPDLAASSNPTVPPSRPVRSDA